MSTDATENRKSDKDLLEYFTNKTKRAYDSDPNLILYVTSDEDGNLFNAFFSPNWNCTNGHGRDEIDVDLALKAVTASLFSIITKVVDDDEQWATLDLFTSYWADTVMTFKERLATEEPDEMVLFTKDDIEDIADDITASLKQTTEELEEENDNLRTRLDSIETAFAALCAEKKANV